MRNNLLLISSALLFALSACSDQIVSSCDTAAPPPFLMAKLSSIQEKILTPNCAVSGCHSGEFPQQNMSLEAGKSYGNLVNVASNESALLRIKPGASSESWLIRKLEGDGTTRMPLIGDPLTPAEIDTIRAWIDRGANND